MAVRGTFDLNERPATDALRRLERQLGSTQRSLEMTGKAVDGVFSDKNVAEAKSYESALSGVERQGRTTFDSLSRNAREAEFNVVGSIRRMDSSTILLRENLDALGRTRATPSVDLDGVAEGIAQVELLERKLSSLSRQTSTPNVNVGGSFGGGLGRVANPRGGGGFSGGGGGLKVPFAGSVPFPLVGAALAAAPPLIGGAGALLGSAGGALLGAGALGVTGGGVGATAGALALPTSLVSISRMKEASKALDAYQKEVVATGPGSKASAQALHTYNTALSQAPGGTKQFLRSRTALGNEFGRATQPGQASVAAIGTRGINLGRQLTPTIAPLSNQFLGAAQGQTNNFANFLNDDRSRDFYKSMGKEATADLTQVEGTAENVARTMENVARAGRPFFHEGMVFLEHWTEGWKTSTNNLRGTRKEIGEFVDDLKAWGKLGSTTFDLGTDLLGGGRKSGTNMVGDLTHQLEVWDEFVVKHPREVREFFDNAVTGTEKIAGAIGKITKLLWEAGKLLTPLLEQGTQLLSVAGNAGLLSPAGLPLLVAGGRGVRSARGAASSKILGGSAAPVMLGGGVAPTTVRGRVPTRAPRMTPTPYGPIELPLQEEGVVGGRIGAAATGAGRFARGFGASLLPYLAISGGLSAVAQPGGIEEKLQAGVAGSSMGLYGGPMSASQRRDQGSAQASSVLRHVMRRSGGDLAKARLEIQRQIAHTTGLSAQTFTSKGRLGGELLGGADAVSHLLSGVPGLNVVDIGGLGIGPSDEGISDDARKKRLEQLLNAERSIRGEQHGRNVGKGAAMVGDVRSALGVNINHNVGGARAGAIQSIVGDIKGTKSAGLAEGLGHRGLGLAQELAKENPKLKGAVDNLAETIENRLGQLGRQVQIINGHIVDVSASSWAKVREAAETETERARAATAKNLTAMERQAMAILEHMGFSGADARGLAKSSFGEHGKKAETAANTITEHGSAIPFSPGYIEKATGNKGGKKRNATGGSFRIGGQGLHDTVNLGGGNMAAPGEALIANRHTERRIDRMLGGFGTSLGREIQNEGRAHSEQFRSFSATGSIIPAARLAQQMGMGVSGGPGPGGGIPSSGHVGDSLHYSGLAYDVTGSAAQMWAYRKRSERAFRSSINELFYDPYPYYIDQGKKVPGSLGGHSDHVHIGFFPGGAKGNTALGRMGGSTRASGHPNVKLRGLKSGVGGLTGMIADAANQSVANAGSKRLNRMLSAQGGGTGGPLPGGGGGSPAANKALARRMLGNFGWGPGEMSPLTSLWNQESGWSTTARNPSSGAYGIPQALPPSKMGQAAQGSGPAAARAQIGWGLKYIKERYGSPAGAWGHEQSNNWYARGGRVPGFAGWYAKGGHFRVKGPTLMGVGEQGEETVKITPKGRGRRSGGGGGMPPIHVTIGSVSVRNAHEAKAVGRRLGQGIAAELANALRDSDGVPEGAVS